MDKNHNVVYKSIIAICILCVVCWGIKDYTHKREINRLLQVKPATNYAQAYSDNTNNKSIYNTEKTIELNKKANKYELESGNEEDKNNEVKSRNVEDLSSTENLLNKNIFSSSKNVGKKEQRGSDFMNTEVLEENNNSAEVIELINRTDTNLDDLRLLAKLIQSEAGQEPYDGKIAVGNVVINRARENNQSIENVIYSKNQFDGVKTDNFNKNPNEESINAAKEVLNGKKVIDSDSYYFVNLEMASPSWAKENTFVTRIGEHWFFRKE